MQECGSISAASLVNYMEREMCELRKMKRSTDRRQKAEKSRHLNKRFQGDPCGVYSMLVLETFTANG